MPSPNPYSNGFSPTQYYETGNGMTIPSVSSTGNNVSLSNPLTSSSYNSNDLQDILDYQKHLEEREDSAYQRMVEDMKKAGLNPWLSVSSGGLNSGSNNVVSDYINSRISQQKADANDTKTLATLIGAVIAAIALFA